ncbi:M64 family metallopeptidase [Epilithonimonas hungarica]|uniref:Por secretion system C-terminal sorting domain-containing protein n=1 Tax=Epilithonimonas hungarica TaxID=454006 RepID=A0A1G7VPP7_9FLAO|nr:M64 family metallopeptidase [Epilithonimonas hungarica]SDG61776.1 Por secretion system C-terminal sorting domain-containing protein [Epilithonimonas hungarica]
MKYFYLLLVLISGASEAQIFDLVPLVQNGSKDKRINLVILGDGYTASEQSAFMEDATFVSDYLMNKQPYSNYKNYFNVYALKVISPQSGVKHPGTASDVTEPVIPVSNPTNYFNTSYDTSGTHRCIYGSVNKVTQTLAANIPEFDMALILGNDTEYGGCGGTYAFLSRNEQAPDVAYHELGHSFGKLADEYWFSGSGESPNKTKTSDPETVRWKNWLNTGSVGIYQFSENTAWYRPHQNCEMRYLNKQFCNVCKETLVEKIHTVKNPIDSFTPTNTSTISTNSNIDLVVNLILPIPNTLKSEWKVNGTTIQNDVSNITIQPDQLNVGNNTVLFSVYDNTTMVRTNNHSTIHLSTISWTISKTQLGVSDIKSNEYDFVLYPNPAKDYFILEGKSISNEKIKVEILDSSGKLIKKQNIDPNQKDKIDISRLNSQNYIINAYKDGQLILSQKMIKN